MLLLVSICETLAGPLGLRGTSARASKTSPSAVNQNLIIPDEPLPRWILAARGWFV